MIKSQVKKTLLEERIRSLQKSKNLLLMSHAVLGYSSFDFNREVIDELVKAGVEMIELQFPFSEPIADGPVLLKANQESIDSGTTIKDCFTFASEITLQHQDTIFIIMTYYNILFKYGVKKFVKDAADAGISGIIIPDLPPEEAKEYIDECSKSGVGSIFLITPKCSNLRIKRISEVSTGMVYCVSRKGVTGEHTSFSKEFDDYFARVRESTNLPLGIGFGVQTRADVEYLKGRADIAIVCTESVKISLESSPPKMGDFLRSLRN